MKVLDRQMLPEVLGEGNRHAHYMYISCIEDTKTKKKKKKRHDVAATISCQKNFGTNAVSTSRWLKEDFSNPDEQRLFCCLLLCLVHCVNI